MHPIEVEEIMSEVVRLRAEVEEARSGLLILEPCVRHYADEENWESDRVTYDGEAPWGTCEAEEALEALSGLRERLEETRKSPAQ